MIDVLLALSTGQKLNAVLALAVMAGCYVVACWIWPFTACARCDGVGKLRSPSGKAWRRCPRCGGRGGKVRWGRRMWGKVK